MLLLLAIDPKEFGPFQSPLPGQATEMLRVAELCLQDHFEKTYFLPKLARAW